MAAGTKVQLRLGDRVVTEVAFRDGELRIGRMKENELVINNLAVSRFHAVLRRVGEVYEIEDLGSENGTYVAGDAGARDGAGAARRAARHRKARRHDSGRREGEPRSPARERATRGMPHRRTSRPGWRLVAAPSPSAEIGAAPLADADDGAPCW